MCWPGAKLESLCSWKEREQKPAKEGGKGFEGEERKRRAGITEGERRRESEEFGAAQLEPEVGVRRQTEHGLQVHPLCGVSIQPWEAQALGLSRCLGARTDLMGGGATSTPPVSSD